MSQRLCVGLLLYGRCQPDVTVVSGMVHPLVKTVLQLRPGWTMAVCMNHSLVECVVLRPASTLLELLPGETLDPGILGWTMVVQVASLSLVRVLFVGAVLLYVLL
jgi:hypothetical protein